MIGLATARISASTVPAESVADSAAFSPTYRSSYYQRSSPMSIPSPTNNSRLSPIDRDELDILTESDAETLSLVPENSSFNGEIDGSGDVPGTASERTTRCGKVTSQLSSSSATTTDSAVSSGPEAVSSRRGSNPFGEFKEYVRSRRQTITSRFPNRLSGPPASPVPMDDMQWRKVSGDSQFEYDDDEDFCTTQYQRRMSVPEKTLRNANYAILRKSIDRRFEIVGAFNKHHTDAYRHFLQSLTCYDLAPQHGVVVVLHADLSVHKAVTVLCQSPGGRVAVVSKSEADGYFGVFTVTDCLSALKFASEQNVDIGDRTLQYFLENVQAKKKLVTAPSNMTVWDVARLFRMNRVHRIPVLQVENYVQTNEILAFICLRQTFVEILKLIDSKAHLTPNFCQLTLEAARIGSWTKLAWVAENALVVDVVNKFLNSKVSCLPLLDEDEQLVGLVTKNDVLDAVADHAKSYLDVLQLPVKSIIRVNSTVEATVTPESSVTDVIRLLINSNRQCAFIVRDQCLLGVVSFSDIMDYILSSSSGNTTSAN
jgi:CBS domain-containing protein